MFGYYLIVNLINMNNNLLTTIKKSFISWIIFSITVLWVVYAEDLIDFTQHADPWDKLTSAWVNNLNSKVNFDLIYCTTNWVSIVNNKAEHLVSCPNWKQLIMWWMTHSMAQWSWDNVDHRLDNIWWNSLNCYSSWTKNWAFWVSWMWVCQ